MLRTSARGDIRACYLRLDIPPVRGPRWCDARAPSSAGASPHVGSYGGVASSIGEVATVARSPAT